MRRSLRIPIVALALCIATSARAGVPDPRFSNVPHCLVVCPSGDIPFTVSVRDVNNSPLVNVTVALDLCACSTVHFCPPQPSDGYTINGCVVSKLTGPTGLATFNLRAGGTCIGNVEVSANGVLLAGLILVQSPDQDGSLMVDGADAVLLATKVGGGDLTGDLDCSNDVTPADQAVLVAHLAHSCDNRTPALPSSWGQVKVSYR